MDPISPPQIRPIIFGSIHEWNDPSPSRYQSPEKPRDTLASASFMRTQGRPRTREGSTEVGAFISPTLSCRP
jgi:hypothetical protein